ncbi:MAG: hypoxanthine phosphoribosyltransferase [Planctomycetota bacterium]|nr:hypoxanthine phosphoribosyltransferase [Planctomycetota bacterium]MDA1250265.1 hypoxanthine phosphoribosyltransferase [Planctomycetota bacterium]
MQRLVDETAIQQRVRELGEQLSEVYRDRPLTVVGVLTGCMLFLADLVRVIDTPHRIGVVHASSYRGKTTTAGDLRVDTNLLPDIRDRDVLIIDDIFDTGKTIEKLVESLKTFEPRSIRTAVLLVKEGRSEVAIAPDFHCFEIPDAFVIGYGLDYNDDYRHLPFIGVLDDPQA